MLEWVGWVATAVFLASYFCARPVALRLTQAVAALLWLAYGLIIGAAPIIAANVLVAGVAGYSAWRSRATTAPEDPRWAG